MKYQDINSIYKLASHINISAKQLTGLLYGLKIDNCYTVSYISKKDGTCRKLCKPNKSLKYVQRRLLKMLQLRLDEIEKENGFKNNVSHGFFRGKSIKTNAAIHRNNRYIVNIDLENFFDSIHYGRVHGFFSKNKYFKLPDIANVIAQLTCYNGVLPQGAPTSPIISNLICQILDNRILKVCKEYKLRYTRYADDMTFSTSYKPFIDMYDEFIEKLNETISGFSLSINENKTRLQIYNNRQIVTGLSVNKKISVRKEFYKNTRSMAYNLYTKGEFSINNVKGTINQLEGRFSFINDLVKYNNCLEEDDSFRLNTLEHKKNLSKTKEKKFKKKLVVKEKKSITTLDFRQNLLYLNIREKDFQKFLFYKYFIGNDNITLLVEGKTDSKYIKAALRKNYKKYPKLVSKIKNRFKYNINFVPYSNRTKYFFGMLEGSGFELIHILHYFINNDEYQNYIDFFKTKIQDWPMKPTVFLFDNEYSKDKPLNQFIKLLAKATGMDSSEIVKKVHSDYIYHIDLNTFLMTIPVNNTNFKQDIEIENLLNLSYINSELISSHFDGKTFDPKKKHGDHAHIGKEIFSKYILDNYNNSKIDFSGFDDLLDLLSKLDDGYNKYTRSDDSLIPLNISRNI